RHDRGVGRTAHRGAVPGRVQLEALARVVDDHRVVLEEQAADDGVVGHVVVAAAAALEAVDVQEHRVAELDRGDDEVAAAELLPAHAGALDGVAEEAHAQPGECVGSDGDAVAAAGVEHRLQADVAEAQRHQVVLVVEPERHQGLRGAGTGVEKQQDQPEPRAHACLRLASHAPMLVSSAIISSSRSRSGTSGVSLTMRIWQMTGMRSPNTRELSGRTTSELTRTSCGNPCEISAKLPPSTRVPSACRMTMRVRPLAGGIDWPQAPSND